MQQETCGEAMQWEDQRGAYAHTQKQPLLLKDRDLREKKLLSWEGCRGGETPTR